ncbi:hypothetical protein [Caudoviricetes sp.]|nr:hypothetical protein [Caudoviricetes sp.]
MYQTKNLLSISSDSKTVKGEKLGFLTGILYLAPANTTKYNTCAMAIMADCAVACLYSAGRGAFNSVQTGRINKTIWFFEEQETFMLQLYKNIITLINKAKRLGLIPLIRLNGTSDIKWENVSLTINGKYYANIFEVFPELQFYDHTKIASRDTPTNYDLTFSYSGVLKYQKYVNIALSKGMRIAVVFRTINAIPKQFIGLAVIGGDNSDIRHVEPQNTIVALYAKGAAKNDNTGFVVDKAHKVFALQA